MVLFKQLKVKEKNSYVIITTNLLALLVIILNGSTQKFSNVNGPSRHKQRNLLTHQTSSNQLITRSWSGTRRVNLVKSPFLYPRPTLLLPPLAETSRRLLPYSPRCLHTVDKVRCTIGKEQRPSEAGRHMRASMDLFLMRCAQGVRRSLRGRAGPV